MFKGTEKQVLPLPDAIEHKVEKSDNFQKVRKSIWRSIYDMFGWSDEFSDDDKKEMSQWRAPYCHPDQRVGNAVKMEIHHKKPKRLFVCQKAANDLKNLIAVSPHMHENGGLLSDEYHYWEYYGKKKEKQREEKFDNSKRPKK